MLINSNEAETAQDPTFNQVFGKTRIANIVKNKSGDRFVHVQQRNRIFYLPVDIVRFCVGKDAWMRKILIKCSDCRKPIKIGETECQMCPDCYQKAEDQILAENS